MITQSILIFNFLSENQKFLICTKKGDIKNNWLGTDRANEYDSTDWKEFGEKYNINSELMIVGNPQQNVAIERFS